MIQVICEHQVSTTVYYNIIQSYQTQLVVDIPNLIMRFYPEETVRINCLFQHVLKHQSCYAFNSGGNIMSYDFNLFFNKESHNMMLCSYSYKITCEIAYLENGINKEDLLFSCTEDRTCDSITSAGNVSDDIQLKLKQDNKIKFTISRKFNKAPVNEHKYLSQGDFFDQLFSNKQFGDVQVIVSGTVFNVHKHILSLRSEVFKAMFSHDMTENKEGLIKINDIKPEVIKEMLSYIYNYEIKNLNTNMSIELYKVAHLYEIHDLKDECIEFIKFNLNSENFISVLKLALNYELNDLKKGVFNYIDMHNAEFVKRNDYQQFLHENLSLQSLTFTLKLCAKYPDVLKNLKLTTSQYIKSHSKLVVEDKEYLDLFETHHELIKEIFEFLHI